MISVNMLLLNEEEYLPKLLPYLKPFADEIVVLVDDRTTDKSFELAKIYADVVDYVTLNMDFSAARNEAIVRSRGDWMFQVDADEWPQPALLRAFRRIDEENKPSVHGVITVHDNRIDGRPVLYHDLERHLRFFRKNYRYIGRIHEQVIVPWKRTVFESGGMILHHKSSERQQMQNERYAAWPEQP